MIVEEILSETPSMFLRINPESGPIDVDLVLDDSEAVSVYFGNSFTLSGLPHGDLMKLSQLFRQASELAESGGPKGDILKEEEYDCMQDYRAGTMSREEYEDCLRQFRSTSGGYGSGDGFGRYRRRKRQSTMYRGPKPDNTQLLAVMDALVALQPSSRFINSIRRQVASGRRLSQKQKDVMQKILHRNGMSDKLPLFECGEANDPLFADVYGDENVTNLSLDPEHAEELPASPRRRSVSPWHNEGDY